MKRIIRMTKARYLFLRLACLFVMLSFFSSIGFAQNLHLGARLNEYMVLINQNRAETFDEIEKFLKVDLSESQKDSIRNDVRMDVMYHACIAGIAVRKYNDYESAAENMECCIGKIRALRLDPRWADTYLYCLKGLCSMYINTPHLDKAKNALEEYIMATLEEKPSSNIAWAYESLGGIYEQLNDSVLAENAYNMCREAYVKSYVLQNPKETALIDTYNMLAQSKSTYEANKATNSIAYINTLIMMGNILKKACGKYYVEPFRFYMNAFNKIKEDNFFNIRTPIFEKLYVNFRELTILGPKEPLKSQIIEDYLPYEINFYRGILTESDVYKSVALSFAAKGFYKQALKYDDLALKTLDSSVDSFTIKKKRIFKSIITDCQMLETDSANQVAMDYIAELKRINNDDVELSDWCAIEERLILMRLNRQEEADKVIRQYLSDFEHRFGKKSIKYIDGLNQLAMNTTDIHKAEAIFEEAKQLISQTKDVNPSTIRGVSFNLAVCYMQDKNWSKALPEIRIAKEIEVKSFGRADQMTLDMEKYCIHQMKQ